MDICPSFFIPPSLYLHFSPLKDGLAWIWVSTGPHPTHNNPVSSHILKIGLTAQVTTLVRDLIYRKHI